MPRPEVLPEALAVVRGDDHDGVRVDGAEEVREEIVGVAHLALVVGERALVLVALVVIREERGVGPRGRVGLVHLVGVDEEKGGTAGVGLEPGARLRERLDREAG